jgi:hypothetical protein
VPYKDIKCDKADTKHYPLLLPKSTEQATNVVANFSAQPLSNLFSTDLEHRYFRVFCEKVATQLTGFIDSSIWNQLVLQSSEQNESVRHGIIALGALQITLQASKCATQAYSPVARDEHYTFAIKQYSKAITKMRISISRKRNDLRTTLLTSLLIICFECLHGNHESAIAQMKSSLNLLEDWLGSQKSALSDTSHTSNSPSVHSAAAFGFRSPAPNTIEDE